MAYDQGLVERIREFFIDRIDIDEKKMFGGLAFMLSGNMCCGVLDDKLMARVGPTFYEDALTKPYASKMDFTGKPLTGFIYVAQTGIEEDQDLHEWLTTCEAFASALPPK